jgi:hypothetical protein
MPNQTAFRVAGNVRLRSCPAVTLGCGVKSTCVTERVPEYGYAGTIAWGMLPLVRTVGVGRLADVLRTWTRTSDESIGGV